MQAQNNIERAASPNASQRQAIQTTECPLLIIAEPGSGKTFTLVERAFYLIAEKNIPPENILISTFTEKAAREIITRISNKLLENNLDVNLHEIYIGTLHSIFLRILEENKEATHQRDNLVFDDFDQKFFVYIFLLGSKHGKICVVGDDDQLLYRFRGATDRCDPFHVSAIQGYQAVELQKLRDGMIEEIRKLKIIYNEKEI